METVGSETEAYAIADKVAVSKLVHITKDQLISRNIEMNHIVK